MGTFWEYKNRIIDKILSIIYKGLPAIAPFYETQLSSSCMTKWYNGTVLIIITSW